MAEERSNGTPVREFHENNTVDIQHRLPAPDYIEETSAEIAAPLPFNRTINANPIRGDRNETATGGRGIGLTALALSILSLFVAPILFGAAGIIIGFVAKRRGADSLGNWAIGVGAISIIVGVFILPFF